MRPIYAHVRTPIQSLILLVLCALLAGAGVAVAPPAIAQVAQELPQVELLELTLDEAAELIDRDTIDEETPVTEEDPPAPPVTWNSIVARGAALAEQAPERLPLLVHQATDDLLSGRITRRAQVLTGTIVMLLVMLFALIARQVRGSGDVAVLLEYPAELKGTFSVRLSSRKSSPNRSCRIKTPEDAARQGASARLTHHMV